MFHTKSFLTEVLNKNKKLSFLAYLSSSFMCTLTITVYSRAKAAGTTLGICWVQVERAFSTHITLCTFYILLLKNVK